MPELPSGTVTFLFTDIEGSTRLLARARRAVRARRSPSTGASLRDAFAAHGGVEVDTQGDAFFFAFADAPRRSPPRRAGQEALAAGPVSVRMGLHTGDRPRAPTRATSATTCTSAPASPRPAHGGQVVLSKATRDLLDGDAVRDLGEHRRQGLRRAGLDLPARRGALPAAEDDLEHEPPPPRLELRRPGARGRGGRVARPRGAARHADRPRRLGEDPALDRGRGRARRRVQERRLLGRARDRPRPGAASCRRSRRRSARRAISPATSASGRCSSCSTTSSRSSTRAPDLAALVEACPNLRLLVTSRELLRVRGEVEYEVLPLADPDAVELFCLARRLEPTPRSRSSAAASTTCRSRSSSPPPARRSLTPEQILERLGERLDLLQGRPRRRGRGRRRCARRSSGRTTCSTPEEQRLFARLGVFAGGCTLEAAEAVADADLDTLQSLVEKSLLRHTERPLLDARDDPRVRGRAARRVGRRATRSGGATPSTSSRWPSRPTCPRRATGRSSPSSSAPSRTTSARRSTGRVDHALELAFRLRSRWSSSGYERRLRGRPPARGAPRARPGRLARAARPRAPGARRIDLHRGRLRAGRLEWRAGARGVRAAGGRAAVAVCSIASRSTLSWHRISLARVACSRRASRFAVACRTPSSRPTPSHARLGRAMRGKPRARRSSSSRRPRSFVSRSATPGFRRARSSASPTSCYELGRPEIAEARALRGAPPLVAAGRSPVHRVRVGIARQTRRSGGDVARAGRLWGAIEAEESRAPLGNWDQMRDEYAAAIVTSGDAEFEAARRAGHALTLDQAVDYALAGRNTAAPTSR